MKDTNYEITRGRVFNKYYILVCLAGVTYNFALVTLNSTISLYVGTLGVSAAYIGWLFLPFSIGSIICRLAGGYITDHLGRRKTMILGLLLYAAAAYCFGTTTAILALFLFRAMMGMGYSLSNTSGSAANVDVVPSGKINFASGFFFVPSALAQAFIGFVVLHFTSQGKFGTIFNMVAVILLAGSVFAFLCNYEKHYDVRSGDSGESAPKYRGFEKFFERQAVKAAICGVFASVFNSLCAVYILKYATEHNIPGSAYFLTVSSLVMLTLNLTNNRIQKRIGRRLPIVVCCLFSAVSGVLLGLTNSPVFFFAVAVGFGSLSGICMPILYATALENARPERRGAASSTILIANDIGIGGGTVLWGLIVGSAGFGAAFIVASCAAVVCAVLYLIFFRNPKQAA